MGGIVHSWALAEQGHEEGVVQLQQGLARLQATRQGLGRPYFLALLAETCGERGQMEEGMTVLTEALDVADKSGECMHQTKLYRLKGELVLQSAVRRLKSRTVKSPASKVTKKVKNQK